MDPNQHMRNNEGSAHYGFTHHSEKDINQMSTSRVNPSWSAYQYPTVMPPPNWGYPPYRAQNFLHFNASPPPPPPPPPLPPPSPTQNVSSSNIVYQNCYYTSSAMAHMNSSEVVTNSTADLKDPRLSFKEEPAVTNCTREMIQRNEDQNFVNDFVSRIDRKSVEARPLKIREAVELFHQSLQHIDKLKKLHEELTNKSTNDQFCESGKIIEAKTIMDKVNTIFHQFNSSNLALLKKSVMKRRAKRRRSQTLKKILKDRNDRDNHLQEMHDKIDAWQKAIKQEFITAEMERKLKKEADMILSEVRKKKSEATKLLNLMDAIEKLRSLKKESAQKRSLYTPPASDEHFKRTTSNLIRILNSRLAEYEEEERTLQVMLAEEHQETRKTAQQQLEDEIHAKASAKRREEIRCLFGPDVVIDEDDPRFPYWMIYTQADRELDALVEIRRKWDLWIVPCDTPHSSGVPLSWVLPSEPSSKDWAKYLAE